jgi:3'-5' exoribonuclease
MPKPYIDELKEGQSVTSFFAVRKREVREYDGRPFLVLEFGDKTGRIQATIWEDVDQAKDLVQIGDVAKVKGTVINYKDALQIKVEKLRKASPKEYDLADLLTTSDKDREEVFRALQKRSKTVKDEHLRELLRLCFSDPSVVERFKTAPGGKLWHHAYLGGLLEHTLAVMEICNVAATIYPLVDRSLLLAGALLHDIGKIEAYECTTFIDYTDIGRLEGHVVLSAKFVEKQIAEIAGFSQELKVRLLHLVLSHHRELRYGSPVVPMTLEALVLAYANEMDTRAAAFARVIQAEKEPGHTWSRWVNLIDRYIYFGESPPSIEEEPDPGESH